MKIYIVTYAVDDADELDYRQDTVRIEAEQYTVRISAESLEQAFDKAYWGIESRLVIDVREETAQETAEQLRESLQKRREWMRQRARYLATLEGQLRVSDERKTGKVRDGGGAIASTRDAYAPQI